MAEHPFKPGDRVEWSGHGTTTHGEVTEEITADTTRAGRTVRAGEDDPRYRVRSAQSGKDAVHKPEALRPRET